MRSCISSVTSILHAAFRTCVLYGREIQDHLQLVHVLKLPAAQGKQVEQKVKKKVETGQEDLKKKVDGVHKDVNDLQEKVDELLEKVDTKEQQNQ
ncbi:MAG: hypothetical protein M3P86_07745 [Actinomycetota bacterium]|nr:hypothetical protein [Actinomycetota bacterium]